MSWTPFFKILAEPLNLGLLGHKSLQLHGISELEPFSSCFNVKLVISIIVISDMLRQLRIMLRQLRYVLRIYEKLGAEIIDL